MNETNSRKSRRFFGGTGFYIALFLCVTALAVLGYWTLLPHNAAGSRPVADETSLSPEETGTAERDETEIVPASMPDPEEAEETAASEPAQIVQNAVELPMPPDTAQTLAPVETPPAEPAEAEEVTPVAPHLVVAPLTGETVAAFSVEELLYSETMGDWRTHDGVDIAAPAGTQVLSACSGTVDAVENDDLLGIMIVLSHDGGYQTIYANLQDVAAIAEGDYVSAGQVIGTVGQTSLAESALPPHLHFAVLQNGDSVDPDEFLDD